MKEVYARNSLYLHSRQPQPEDKGSVLIFAGNLFCEMPGIFLTSALITAVIQLSGFAVAYTLRTELFYDILGGLNFLSLAGYSAWAAADGLDTRKLATTVIFVCSRSWLLIFLAWRAHERKGDARFDGVKDKFGLFLVFWVAQGFWVMMVSSPVLLINASTAAPPALATSDLVLLGSFFLGVVCEVAADVTKARWVQRGRIGGFCQDGLWHYSRHPNYFGEMLQWWSAWLLALASAPGGLTDVAWLATSASPLFTMHILLNLPATGVAQANGKSLRRYYEGKHAEAYAAYRSSTSILLPLPPRLYRAIPLPLKRTLFLDLSRYEYKPKERNPGHPSGYGSWEMEPFGHRD